MPRRGNVPKRDVLDDPIYGGKLVTKLINQVMLDGKRGVAQQATYGAFEIIRTKTGREPLEVFQECMNTQLLRARHGRTSCGLLYRCRPPATK